MRILVVEDDPSIANLLRVALERDGYDIAHAGTGEGGLNIAREWDPDVVILDLMLPDVSGREVARRIRESSDVPIVIVSAMSEERDRVVGLDLGADDYIVDVHVSSLRRKLGDQPGKPKYNRNRPQGGLPAPRRRIGRKPRQAGNITPFSHRTSRLRACLGKESM